MSIKDCFDLAISGADANAARGYNRYVTEFLSYGANLRELFKIADENPGAPLLNAHAAALHMAFEGAEGWDFAAPYLKRMHDHAGSANSREQLLCTAVDAWAKKDFRQCAYSTRRINRTLASRSLRYQMGAISRL